MDRSIVTALYYICPIKNLDSILRKGIMSHNRARIENPESVADPIIQERRENVVVPGANKKLHDYANLYFNARNAMMSAVRARHLEICVLSISPDILDDNDAIITDRNASSGYTHFYPSPSGLEKLNQDLVYSKDWRHSDQFEYWKRKSSVCAEVLVPCPVTPGFISGIFVSCQQVEAEVELILSRTGCQLPISIEPDLFFQ